MGYQNLLKVNYFDCDSNNMLKISAAMRYMQQTSSEHLETLDMSPRRLFEQSMVFLLTKMCIRVHRMPYCTEEIVVSTAAVEVRGVRFFREFTIESPVGERLLSALSLWVLVDPASHKVLRPSIFPYELPLQSSILNGAIEDLPFPKLLTEGRRLRTDVQIRYSHLDLNKHVNNSMYGDFVCDALPYEQLIARGLDTMVIHFQNEAGWGENLEITTNILGEKDYHLIGLHGDGSGCFEAYAALGDLRF